MASAHEEFGERKYLASTVEFVGDERGVIGIKVAETEYRDGRRLPKPGTERIMQADLVLLALGFSGPEDSGLKNQLDLALDERGNLVRNDEYQSNLPDVFVVGDAGRGQSLIVWAIAEGRAAAAKVDAYLEGSTELPYPVKPTDHSFAI